MPAAGSRLTPEEVAHMASGDRWAGLSRSMPRAAAEIYWMIRQEGHANVREWWQSVWGTSGATPQRSDMWHAACAIDLRIAEFSAQGPQALAAALTSDDLLEGLLRQVATAREFSITRDAEAASRILGFRMPGDSIVPGWLRDDSRSHSMAVHKQDMRTKQPKNQGGGDGRGKGKGKPEDDGGGGRGRGRGRGRGAAPAATNG